MNKNYDYADDYAEDQVVNVSGEPSPNTEVVRRPRTISASPPGQHVSHRTPVMIDSQSGQALDERLAKGLTLAAQRRLSIRRTVNRLDDPERGHLAFLFGIDRPGHDREV